MTPVEATVDDKDNKAIFELGAATNWNLGGGVATFAPNLAAEITPIEKWLELELGVSPLYIHTAKGMGYRPALKKAMDPVAKSRVHARRRPGVGSTSTRVENGQTHWPEK